MTKGNPEWEQFEKEVQYQLGLSGTIASGNQMHDPGDAVDKRHPSETDFPVMLDAKTTIHKSYSIKAKEIQEWNEKALSLGHIFGLPIRFLDELCPDLIVVKLNDFRDLYLAQEKTVDKGGVEKAIKALSDALDNLPADENFMLLDSLLFDLEEQVKNLGAR